MTAKIGSTHTKRSGIFLVVFSGSSVASEPRMGAAEEARRRPAIPVHGRSFAAAAGAQPKSTRLVAGW